MRSLTKKIVRACGFSTTASLPVGDVYVWNEKAPVKLALPEKAKRVSLGQSHSCIVGESG